MLHSCIEKAQMNITDRRSMRFKQLLNRLKRPHSVKDEQNSLSCLGEAKFYGAQVTVSTLGRMIGFLEESILANCLTIQVYFNILFLQ